MLFRAVAAAVFAFTGTFISSASDESGKDTLIFMFWNLENFFDWTDTGLSDSDREFSSSGERRWTKSRFYTKCDAVAKTMLWIENMYGRIPDVAGFSEVENEFVVRSLLTSTALSKYGYGKVHYDSPDSRGIDVALIYRKDIFRYSGSSPHKVGGLSSGFRTRNILHVCLQLVSGNQAKLDFLVNHHPSKYGGRRRSYPRREAAVKTLSDIADSLVDRGTSGVVAMGDFNDTPDSPVFRILEKGLENMADSLFISGEGTIRFRGKWELIDFFLVSEKIAESSEMYICRVPFLMVWDSSFPGKKPLRTYTGPRYSGGVSDHLPIILMLELN